MEVEGGVGGVRRGLGRGRSVRSVVRRNVESWIAADVATVQAKEVANRNTTVI